VTDVAYVALGSNVGDRAAELTRAREAIARIHDTRIIRQSRVEETAPIGPVPQGSYLNQMIAVETKLTPQELLAALQRIEEAAGRVRSERWGPRTLDLDIVMIEGQQLRDDRLTIPHPELANRDFWQRELSEVRNVDG
jgi:2-amino-4-hydroxy-6-hydroxymethyldihydropteridine diphosphokinase